MSWVWIIVTVNSSKVLTEIMHIFVPLKMKCPIKIIRKSIRDLHEYSPCCLWTWFNSTVKSSKAISDDNNLVSISASVKSHAKGPLWHFSPFCRMQTVQSSREGVKRAAARYSHNEMSNTHLRCSWNRSMCLESYLNIPSPPTTKRKGQHANTHSLARGLIAFIPADHTNWVLLTPAISHLIEGKTSSSRRCIYLWATLSF